MKKLIIFIIILNGVTLMKGQEFLDEIGYNNFLSTLKGEANLTRINKLSNSKFEFFLIAFSRRNYLISQHDKKNNSYYLFDDYVGFKKKYEAKNRYIVLPTSPEELFNNSELNLFEIEVVNQVKNKDWQYFIDLFEEIYDIDISPSQLTQDNVKVFDEKFKDFRVDLNSSEEQTFLFTIYFIEYLKLYVKNSSECIIQNEVNVFNQEYYIPNLIVNGQMANIYSIIETHKYINRTINPLLLKYELDMLINELDR